MQLFCGPPQLFAYFYTDKPLRITSVARSGIASKRTSAYARCHFSSVETSSRSPATPLKAAQHSFALLQHRKAAQNFSEGYAMKPRGITTNPRQHAAFRDICHGTHCADSAITLRSPLHFLAVMPHPPGRTAMRSVFHISCLSLYPARSRASQETLHSSHFAYKQLTSI